jgi:hypothetical protein
MYNLKNYLKESDIIFKHNIVYNFVLSMLV